ncbi:fatty acid desaturase family protein [Paracoccus spongiarum]|uniref:Fatty acid desaturase family protein n=1 Tax=Paracoccus spongiarum TaxID=3064387 RepID=A0ABT9JEN8_9RHOB|nr:fatty acid desaturase family protein [Paracoccus sp. 2205BS29-5]MDP5307531.1 fatty acid desaturase family protein [Paracoccus sp. 2205BS29-5]
MPEAAVTPLTQALSEGRLTRAELRALMARSDRPAAIHLALWFLLLAATSTLVWLALGSWWLVPAMFLHGVVLVHHFSLQHECVHYTVFRTRWLNDLAGNLCGLVIGLPHQFFRYEHCDHHNHTQLPGDDPELIEMPRTLGEYLWYLSAIPYWRGKLTELLRHAAGRLTPAERRFVPKVAEAAVIREARLMLGVYAAILAAMPLLGWWAPLWFWLVPLILGEPVMRFIRMTEHVGRPTVAEMRLNTRTNLVSRPLRFLCWNMNFHAEHHYAASVPYHALPRLHEKLKDYLHVEPGGYLGAHRDILSRLRAGSRD